MNQFKLGSLGRLLWSFGALIVVSQLLTVWPVGGDDRINRLHAGRQDAPRRIFVASNGWHSAIFVARDAIQERVIPEIADFPMAAFLGFGWGDATFFPARDPGILTLLSAAAQPTPSVIHVTGLQSHPRDAFPKDEVIGLALSVDELRDLLIFLSTTFARGGAARIKPHAPGLHSYSNFYRATGDFHLFNNCNSWTARALSSAGLPLEADSIYRAEGLMVALRNIEK